MRTLLTRLMMAIIVFVTAILFSAAMSSQYASGASRSEDSIVNMGAVLDMLLSPKSIDIIEPLSQWNGKNIITSDNNFSLPQPLVPIYCNVTGLPDPDDLVFYVLNSWSESGFGSIVYESVTYSYWESDAYPYLGPLEPMELPYSITLILSRNFQHKSLK